MKKETLAEKFARKSFESAGIQKSWQVHMQAFGPILEPAFRENFQARIHLTNALNHISTRDIRTGLKKLRLVEKFCETDADKAAWLFLHGTLHGDGKHQGADGCLLSERRKIRTSFLPSLSEDRKGGAY